VTAKRGSARHAERLARHPDQVWALLGAPDRVHEWFPGIASCTVNGDQRVIVTGSGIPMPEQILTVDPALRRFQYRITAPMFAEHLSTIDVHDLEDGTCLAVYSVDADPAPLALVIGGAARTGLEGLDAVLGSRERPTAFPPKGPA
jgi:Polyketide cyclase / dehydrase and lipid transport